MHIDATFNKDVDDGVILHIALMYNLALDDPNCFVLATPKRGSSTSFRVWEQILSLHQIMEDTDRLLMALIKMLDADDIAATGVVPQKGHQHAVTKSLKKRRKKSKKRRRCVVLGT